MKPNSSPPATTGFVEDIEVSGHIIDSLILPKVLDCITQGGGQFRIKRISIGQGRNDPSYALVEVSADTSARLAQILSTIGDHGAVPVVATDARLTPADIEGCLPENFYSTTNQRTEIRLQGKWISVDDQEMDCGVVVDPATGRARCIAMADVKVGQQIVVGHAGTRVFPYVRGASSSESFEFMNSPVSTEKPKGVAIRQIAEEMHRVKKMGGRVLLVGGPAIVHTGSVEHVSKLIRDGYIHRLFAGNALATHDLEQAVFGTSLGVDMGRGSPVEHGHEHHLRTINRIRRAGGIKPAVEQGIVSSGIMYECVKHNVPYVLCGSIRDDGPLTDVITDSLQCQTVMREHIRDVSFCLMVATTLHSIAVGNLLPGWVKVVCVDINPSTVIKLYDRGSFQTVGLVTDVEPFFRALVQEIEALE